MMKKTVKGMASYFTHVKKISLGVSNLDFLMINVPPICNYRCKKCFTSAGLRKIENPLSLNEWFYIISEGEKNGVKNVSILGEGEPLIYNNIKKVIKYINDIEMIPMIATNALALDSDMADFLYKNNVTVGFSLDTLDEDEYNNFCRGDSDLNIVTKNIEYARKLFAQDIKVENNYKVYRLVLHMTITPENYHKMNQLIDFCGDDIFFDCQPLANVGVAKDNYDYINEEMSYEQFQKYGYIVFPPMVLSQDEFDMKICCLFNYGIAFNYAGDVMFDTHALEPFKYIGNIRDLPFKELLDRSRKLKNYFLKNFRTSYCPVRDKSYNIFIKHLNNSKKNFLWEEN